MSETDQPAPQQQGGRCHGGTPETSTPEGSCRFCGVGPIVFERDACTVAVLILFTCCFAVLFLPKKEAKCAACGKMQGYSPV